MTSSPPPGSARAHPWHAFDGMRISLAGDGTRLIAARCSCGEVIDVAEAVFSPCAGCGGAACPRCGGSGEVVDHRALAWRAPTAGERGL